MWNHIVKSESNLIKAIGKIRKLEKHLEISPPEKTVNLCYLLFTTICILTVCADAYSYASLTKSALRTFTFAKVDIYDIHWSIELFAFIIRQFAINYGSFFVHYFGVFYIILCRYMVLILKIHAVKNEKTIKTRFITFELCNICFIRYGTILSVFNTLNLILGFPIFLGSSYNACDILLSVLKIWKSGHDVVFRDISFLVNSFMLFTAISFTASDVNEVDKSAKNSNIKILRTLSSKDRSQIKESIDGLSQMCYSPPFALNGWDIFEFTKSFYVTAIGSFATYSLLIINL